MSDIEYEMELLSQSNDPADIEKALTYYKSRVIRQDKKTEGDKKYTKFDLIDFNWILKQDIPDVEYLIKNLLPTYGLHVLLGASKIGKSWLSLQWAYGIATGGAILGKIKVEKCKVLYFNLEESWELMRRRADQLKLPAIENGFLHSIHNFPKECKNIYHSLNCTLTDNPDIKFVLIDTMQKFLKISRLNEYDVCVNALSQLKEIADKHKVSILLIHHAKKDKDNEDWIDGGLGSMGIVATADTILKLSRKRNEGRAELNITGRSILETEYILSFDNQCGWIIEGDKKSVIEGDCQRLIYDWLVENGAHTPTEIHKGLVENGYKGTLGTIKTLLHRMCKAERLTSLSGVYTPSSVNSVNPVNHEEKKDTDTVDTVDMVDSISQEELEIY